MKNNLPKEFTKNIQNLRAYLINDLSAWQYQRANQQIPLRKIVTFLWDRLSKTPLNKIEKKKFIANIFSELNYKDYSSISKNRAVRRIYQLLYRAGR